MLDPQKVELWYSTDYGDGVYARLQKCKDLNIKGICLPSSYMYDTEILEVLGKSKILHGLETIVAVGFPSGMSTSSAKVAEITDCRTPIVSAVDVVLNLDWIKGGKWKFVREEMISILTNCTMDVRWILEVSILTEYQILRTVDMIMEHGGDVKTGTGYAGHTGVHHIELIRRHLDTAKSEALIKASGGIRSETEALRMLDAGANIIGISNLGILS